MIGSWLYPSRAGSPSPATRPGCALWRGAPRARLGGGLARGGGARGAGRRQARAPAGAEGHGVGGRGRWKRPFDFPILILSLEGEDMATFTAAARRYSGLSI